MACAPSPVWWDLHKLELQWRRNLSTSNVSDGQILPFRVTSHFYIFHGFSIFTQQYSLYISRCIKNPILTLILLASKSLFIHSLDYRLKWVFKFDIGCSKSLTVGYNDGLDSNWNKALISGTICKLDAKCTSALTDGIDDEINVGGGTGSAIQLARVQTRNAATWQELMEL